MKTISTRVARHLDGDNLFFGHSVLKELLPCEETCTGMIALAVTGRRASAEQRASLDELAVIMTSADPRIWPLKLTRLVASYGGTLAAHAAGQLAMEGDQIGPWIIGHSAAMFVALHAAVGDAIGNDALLEERVRNFVKRVPRFIGYGVPLRQSDERMDALTERMRSNGRDALPFWKLQIALSNEIRRVKGLAPNVGAGLAAMLLDHGYDPREASALTTFLNQNVFAANAYEAAAQSEEIMRTLPCDAIDYVGHAPRVSPRARALEIPADRASTGNYAAETS